MREGQGILPTVGAPALLSSYPQPKITHLGDTQTPSSLLCCVRNVAGDGLFSLRPATRGRADDEKNSAPFGDRGVRVDLGQRGGAGGERYSLSGRAVRRHYR